MFKINLLLVLPAGLVLSLLMTIPAIAGEATNSCCDSGCCTQSTSSASAENEIDLIAVYKELGLPDDPMKLITELATNPRPVTYAEWLKLMRVGCAFRTIYLDENDKEISFDEFRKYLDLQQTSSSQEKPKYRVEQWLAPPIGKSNSTEMSEELRKTVFNAGVVISSYKDCVGNWVIMYDDRYAVYSEDGTLLRSGAEPWSVLPYDIEIECLRIVYVQMLPEFFTIVTYDDGWRRQFNGKGEIVGIQTGN